MLLESAESPLAVLSSRGIAKERINTVGRVVIACGVVKKRSKTVGRVAAAFCVVKECERSIRCVEAPGRIA